jgi:hypothetical protein
MDQEHTVADVIGGFASRLDSDGPQTATMTGVAGQNRFW